LGIYIGKKKNVERRGSHPKSTTSDVEALSCAVYQWPTDADFTSSPPTMMLLFGPIQPGEGGGSLSSAARHTSGTTDSRWIYGGPSRLVKQKSPCASNGIKTALHGAAQQAIRIRGGGVSRLM
jgi:hypothetical protein